MLGINIRLGNVIVPTRSEIGEGNPLLPIANHQSRLTDDMFIMPKDKLTDIEHCIEELGIIAREYLT
jgi:hypothetical protein